MVGMLVLGTVGVVKRCEIGSCGVTFEMTGVWVGTVGVVKIGSEVME